MTEQASKEYILLLYFLPYRYRQKLFVFYNHAFP